MSLIHDFFLSYHLKDINKPGVGTVDSTFSAVAACPLCLYLNRNFFEDHNHATFTHRNFIEHHSQACVWSAELLISLYVTRFLKRVTSSSESCTFSAWLKIAEYSSIQKSYNTGLNISKVLNCNLFTSYLKLVTSAWIEILFIKSDTFRQHCHEYIYTV